MEPWQPDPAHFPAALLAELGFVALRAVDAAAGRVCVEYQPRPALAHSGGAMVQGGFITAWLDNAMAFAAAARMPQAGVASLEIKVSFYDRVPVAPVLATAWIRRAGRRIVFLEAELCDAAGAVLAGATSTCRVVQPAAGPGWPAAAETRQDR